jgi:hypothetical protein
MTYTYTLSNNNILYLKAVNVCEEQENNLYGDMKSQQLCLIVYEECKNDEKEEENLCGLADDF